MNEANTKSGISPGISRWVLLLEWIACFAPLTLVWCAGLAFIATQDRVPLGVIAASATGTLGPAALIFAVAATFSGLYARNSRAFRVLSIAFAAMATLQLLNVGAAGLLRLQWFEFDGSLFVLFGLLPLLGCLHLLQLSRQSGALAVPA